MMKPEDRLDYHNERLRTHDVLLLFLFGIAFILLISVSLIFIYQNNRILDLEASTINASEWVEGCGEWETIENHIVIENKQYNCKAFYIYCSTDIDCFNKHKAGELLSSDWIYLSPYSPLFDSYVDCAYSEKLYIHTWTDEVCSQEILVKK